MRTLVILLCAATAFLSHSPLLKADSEGLIETGRLKKDLFFPAKSADWTDNLGAVSLSHYTFAPTRDSKCIISLLSSHRDRVLYQGDEFTIDYRGQSPFHKVLSSELTSFQTFTVKVRLVEEDPTFFITAVDPRTLQGDWGMHTNRRGETAIKMNCSNRETSATTTDQVITLSNIPAQKRYAPGPHCKAVQEASAAWVYRQYETVYYCFSLDDIERAIPQRAAKRRAHEAFAREILSALIK